MRNKTAFYHHTLLPPQSSHHHTATSSNHHIIKSTPMTTPTWLNSANIKITLDARPLLAQGIHPLEMVQQQCASLNPGEIFEIITPFPPSPMIEKMGAAGFKTYSEMNEDVMFHTYFCR
jgi:hypothetical protein